MNRSCNPAFLLSRSRVAVAGCVVGLLSACGGDDPAGVQAPTVATAPATAAAARVTTSLAEPLAPLVADDGSLMPASPRSVPQDRAARTRAGRYASPAQAEQMEQALGQDVLSVNIGCCGIEAADLAVAIAQGLQAAHDLPRTAPVLVRGADLRLAAAVANRLSDEGYTQVWLVTR